MREHTARKRFGQHFLTDQALIARMVAAIAPRDDETLVEIGPGQGALTLPLLEALDLSQYFDAIVGGDTFACSKPHAEPVHGAIERAGGRIEGSIMIGDSGTDINAARNAGIPVIAVDFGYTPVPVSDLGPDKVISHFNELSNAIDAVNGSDQ